MKKFTLILMMLGLGCSVFAQRVENPINSNSNFPFAPGYTGKTTQLPSMPSSHRNNNIGMNKYSPISAWYDFVASFANAQVNGGFDLSKNRYDLTMFPDTFVKIIYINSGNSSADPQYNNWCSFGTCFDPTDTIFSNDGDTLDAVAKDRTYTVDSVAYFYTYHRNTDTTVIDTLVFQATKANSWFVIPDAVTKETVERAGSADYDNVKGIAKNMGITVKIPLTIKDTSTAFFRTWAHELGITCDASKGEYVMTTITFLPGRTYSMGDTIADFYAGDTTAGKPKRKFNQFGLLVDFDNNYSENKHLRPNNGMVVNAQQRYLPTWFQNSASAPKYIIFEGFGAGAKIAFYPRTNYKVTGFTGTGITEALKDGYGLGDIYPNPVNGNATIEFALGKPGNMNIVITDILGRNVMNVASGNFGMGSHKISVNTEGMKPGVYFYTINANGYTQTKKFTVAQ